MPIEQDWKTGVTAVGFKGRHKQKLIVPSVRRVENAHPRLGRFTEGRFDELSSPDPNKPAGRGGGTLGQRGLADSRYSAHEDVGTHRPSVAGGNATVKLLIDTNIVIPLDPTSKEEIKTETPTVTAIVRRAQQAKAQLFIHPAIRHDVARDGNDDRRRAREVLLTKYEVLSDPPAGTAEILNEIGEPQVGTNDWVDDQLLIAVARNAVDCLVTDDNKIHRKARRLGLTERVLRAVDAVDMLGAWIEEAPAAPPALRNGRAHGLNESDPFFESLAADYGGKPFYDWLARAKLAHRECWSAKDHNGLLEALVITKHETDDVPAELIESGKVLKICTFKVAPQARGVGLGEQLLKACFGYCYRNEYTALFVTLFEAKQPELRDLLEEFGFKKCVATTKLGEAMMAKHLDVRPNEGGLAAHILFGPRLLDWAQPMLVVPIQPRFCELLFPERSTQTNLLAPRSTSANGIRKAYLCNSPMKSIAAGSVLLFYRSQSKQGVIAVGVVEGMTRSSSTEALLVFAGRRTVYSERSIRALTEDGKREVLAIRFRESRLPSELVPLADLKTNKILRAGAAVDHDLRCQRGGQRLARTENTRVALLSIHPIYARGIIEKKKTVEFRRRSFGPDVTHVVVYATAPLRKVIGVFSVAYLDEGSPAQLWERHGERGLIERKPFFRYFKDAKSGVAIVIDNVHALQAPLSLRRFTGRSVGPQSFQYVDAAALRKAGLSPKS